jgi:3-dehydroquinate dehydratase / shikimate dehydrogenase
MIETERLILRPWKQADLAPFAAMNADPRVMVYFPAVKSFKESEEEYRRILNHFTKWGWGLWAVSENGRDNFCGIYWLEVH